MTDDQNDLDVNADDRCVTHDHPVPPGELDRYAVDCDPHSEMDIARYVEHEAQDETVQHVERIKREVVLGEVYDIWDVITNKDRWWVINNLTNLYSQKHFPNLDYTLSFHIGLMTRLKSRSEGSMPTTLVHLTKCLGVENKPAAGTTVQLRWRTIKLWECC